MGCSDGDVSQFRVGVAATARMLYAADPLRMSILRCSDFREQTGPHPRFELFYEVPSYFINPQTLRDLLMPPTTDGVDSSQHSLDQRFRLANKLVTAVLYVHSVRNFVHKNIKPENIVVFKVNPAMDKRCSGYVIGLPFLLGFDH